jgi:hypothetical protein
MRTLSGEVENTKVDETIITSTTSSIVIYSAPLASHGNSSSATTQHTAAAMALRLCQRSSVAGENAGPGVTSSKSVLRVRWRMKPSRPAHGKT